MNKETCIIFNDVNADCPEIIPNEKVIIIRLAQSSTNYWAQTIFQLSHELCHYVIRQHKMDKSFTLSWFEELVCESFSLYILRYASEHWHSCLLSKNSTSFYKSIGIYLDTELKRTGNNVLKECVKNKNLYSYEKIAQNQRETRRNERNQFFIDICHHPKDMKELCNYQQYICEDKVTIDFEKWYSETNNILVNALWNIIYN